MAHRLVRLGTAKIVKVADIRTSPRQLHDRVTAERKPRRPHAPTIDMRPKLRIRQQPIQHIAQVRRPLPPKQKSRRRIPRLRIVSRMIHRRGHKPRPRQRRAQPRHLRRRPTRPMRQQNQRKRFQRRRKARMRHRHPSLKQRPVWRSNELLGLDCRLCRGIPHRHMQRVHLRPAPIARLHRRKLASYGADLVLHWRGSALLRSRSSSDQARAQQDKAKSSTGASRHHGQQITRSDMCPMEAIPKSEIDR